MRAFPYSPHSNVTKEMEELLAEAVGNPEVIRVGQIQPYKRTYIPAQRPIERGIKVRAWMKATSKGRSYEAVHSAEPHAS